MNGERGGKVVIELRLDGTMAIRFRTRHLKYQEVAVECRAGGSAPRPPEFGAFAADASGEEEAGPAPEGARPAGVQPAGGRSDRTPAEPYPPDGAAKDRSKKRRGPAEDHPWKKKPFKRQK